ncbi:MAG TPA: cysteine desulfurase NifS [Blastocatellia bacterium]|nr:cysteine desulfurase NifS [Blastocatellia bacterium]
MEKAIQRRVYLDTSATTPVDPDVIDAMMPFFRQEFGNASSIHTFGQTAKAAIDKARKQVAALIGCTSSEITFVSGGTEADNLAIKGIAEANKQYGNHIITSRIEHPAVLNTCAELERQGFEVTYLSVNKSGAIDIDDLRRATTDQTILITVMTANNETGAIQPISDVAEVVREIRQQRKTLFFHTDAVQAVGRIPVNVDELGVDLLSLSGHKFYAPKGTGALYVRRGVKLKSQLHGGRHERDRRAGTESVPLIVALGKAAELAKRHLGGRRRQIGELRNYLESEILRRIPEVSINGDVHNRVPNLTNLSFRYVEGEGLLISLDLKGVAVSTGSACSSGSLEPSHVLLAMGLTCEEARESLRFSLGKDTTREDIDYVLEILPGIVDRLRKMSPLYQASELVAGH